MKRNFKHVKSVTISKYPSIEELLKEHPGKAIEEYIKMQSQYIEDKLEELENKREDLVQKVKDYKNKSIYTKEVYKDEFYIYFCRNYNFILTKAYSIDYDVEIITITSHEISCYTHSKTSYNLDFADSNINKDVTVITEEEFNKVYNIVQDTFKTLNMFNKLKK